MSAEVTAVRTASPAYQAYLILQIAYVVAPIAAGADKFFHVLTNWDKYLAPLATSVTGLTAHTFLLGVGVIEIIAGLIVAFAPRVGAWIVGLWLCGIIVNLLILGSYFDIALRDFGLALGAFAFARLSSDFSDY